MVNYEVTLFTGDRLYATTFNNVYLKLVGTDGESNRTWAKGHFSFATGSGYSFTMSCTKSIGELVLVELDKQPLVCFTEDAWFAAKVEVKSPEGDTYTFPIYRWIDDSEVHIFREGKALRVFEDKNRLGCYDREKELKQRKKEYCWDVYANGIPHCIKAEDPTSLPAEVRFSFTKETQFKFTALTGLAELKLNGLADNEHKWTDMDEINRVFWRKDTAMSEYVFEHWKEDEFFGFQFLNGVNPMLIRRCTALPQNFRVSDGMVFIPGGSSLKEEMERGNVFLVDYKLLDGVTANTINGKKQYLMAPLVLLHKRAGDQLMPIAIQLKQIPGDDNPIFFPTDSEYDWLTAKTFVRSADFNLHQLNFHLLRTHLLAEVFSVSLLRNMPMVHPLYKLLVPHTRYTLQINFMARHLLISPDGIFTKIAATGGDSLVTVLEKSLSSMTYSSLCIPDDIVERGVEGVPNYHYREDGQRLWKIIHRFVEGVLSYYYKSDSEVQKDTELQQWISDIFKEGFLSKASTGIPQKFDTVAELVKFVTMVIFTCSAQHAAVNSGQYDYGGWMPNSPSSLQLPPPTKKGTTDEGTLLQTFPDINTTANGMAAVWLLSKQSADFVSLGNYPEVHFTEETPLKLIKKLQGELKVLKTKIEVRNDSLDLKYTYLNPETVENSVSI